MNKVMKANAPKKVYVYIPDDDIVGTTSTQKEFPHQFVTEEYIREDAFIEKARKWFEMQNEGVDSNGNYVCDMTDFEDFENYMKNEST